MPSTAVHCLAYPWPSAAFSLPFLVVDRYPLKLHGRTLYTLRLTPNQCDDMVGVAVAAVVIVVCIGLML